MTDSRLNDPNAPQRDQLDELLRKWHQDNRAAAEAGRDALMARLAHERVSQRTRQHAQQARATHAALVKLTIWRLIMHRYTRFAASMFVLVALAVVFLTPLTQQSVARDGYIMLPDGGRLDAFGEDGQHIGPCPLKHTDVNVRIAGHFSRTTVRQHYHNPYQQKVEAIYTFPLGHSGAVDRMTMTVGDREIIGEVKERELARQTYEAARDQGYVASLLEQQRPNIFTQSVANIEPGAEITIEISYVEILESVDGQYSFVFPMVVAPRYIPGSPLGVTPAEQGTFAPDTDQVEDASRISPMPVKPDVRAGHDIAVSVRIETGGPGLLEISAGQHDLVQYDERRDGEKLTGVTLALKTETDIPNRDFVLSWKQTGDGIEEAIFTHTGDDETYGSFAGGFFTMILQPPHRVEDDMARPRELIFVLDSSGSMSSAGVAPGYSAIEGAKDIISSAIDTMRPNDRFNIISFSNNARALWDHPMPNTEQNRQLAQQYIAVRQGGGGTEMRKAVLMALGAMPTATGDQLAISVSALANLPADSRSVTVRIEPSELLKHDRATGVYSGLLAGDNVLLDLDLQVDLPEQHLHGGGAVIVRGRWITRDGRRVLIVTDADAAHDAPPADGVDPMRIVMFLTDGLVGNDDSIVQAVRDHSAQSRMFTIGMSRSPNRALLDAMAEAGRGAVDYMLPGEDVQEIVNRFTNRIATPVLTDITLEFDGVEVVDVMPGLDRLPDLFDVAPLVIHGRYTQPGEGLLTIRGRTGAGDYERTLALNLPAEQEDHDVIATLWARASIDQLMKGEQKDAIVALGEQFQVMSKYTSFVAVEMQRKTIDGKSTLVRVPIEFPKDMSWEGTFGTESESSKSADLRTARLRSNVEPAQPARPRPDAAATVPEAPAAPPVQEQIAQESYWHSIPLDGSRGPSGSRGSTPGPAGSIGGGMGGGGGGGGGGIFGDPAPLPGPPSAAERLDIIMNMVMQLHGPEHWQPLGGSSLDLIEINGRLAPIARDKQPLSEHIAARVQAFLDANAAILNQHGAAQPHFGAPQPLPFGPGSDDGEVVLVVYNIKDLADDQSGSLSYEAAQALIDIIVEQVEPETWFQLGGDTGQVYLIDHSLFIAHHPDVHNAIKDLLSRLRVAMELPLDASAPALPADDAQARIRFYSVKGIALELDRLIDLIMQVVDTNGWQAMGGDTGSIQEFAGLLIINNTPANHHEVEALLERLRIMSRQHESTP